MVPDEGWVEVLNQKWDKNIVTEETSKFPELTLQAETEQRPHKLDVKIIYSGGMDLDILPQEAGKWQVLAYLHKKFKIEGKLPGNTLVREDSGNDVELFTIPDVYGVMVKNAQEELLQWHSENAKDNPKIIHATERCVAGIIQAIGHFGLGPSTFPRDVAESDSVSENFESGYEIVKFYLFIERLRRGEMEFSDLFLADLKAVTHPSYVFVHPSGTMQSNLDFTNASRGCYVDKQGKHYRIWVDQVLTTDNGSNHGL